MAIDNLTKCYANCELINPDIVMVALVGAIRDHEVPAYARMHEAQRVAWHRCAIMANAVEFMPDQLPSYPFIKETVGGLPITIDNKLCPSTIMFHNAEGKPVARIQMLAIPRDVGGEEFPSLLNCNSYEEIEHRVKEEGWLYE
jgi:hypothetical protein